MFSFLEKCEFAACDDSIVIPHGILDIMYFDIMTRVIVGVACLDRCMIALEYKITGVYLLGEVGGVPIILIKLILGVINLILFIIAPKCHSHPFSLPPSNFLK